MRLRVATFNVWGLSSWLTRDFDARMHAVAESFASLPADVLALQEVWTHAARGRLIDAARAAGLQHVWHNEAATGGSGLVVASRLPFARRSFEPYEAAGLAQRVTHADYYGGKGLALLELDTRPVPVALVNTHLHARYVRRAADDEYIGHRTAQIVQLAARLADVPHPVIALGDLNLVEGESEYAVLSGLSGLVDVAAALGRRQPTVLGEHPYRGPRAAPARIDYVMTRDGETARSEPVSIRRIYDQPVAEGDRAPIHYSDHAGLVAEIDILETRHEPARPPQREAMALAAALLERGRRDAAARRRHERAVAGTGLASALAAWLGSRHPKLSRRRFLRGGLKAGSALAALRGGAALGLAEHFGPEELASFAAAEESLARLARRADEAEDKGDRQS